MNGKAMLPNYPSDNVSKNLRCNVNHKMGNPPEQYHMAKSGGLSKTTAANPILKPLRACISELPPILEAKKITGPKQTKTPKTKNTSTKSTQKIM